MCIIEWIDIILIDDSEDKLYIDSGYMNMRLGMFDI